MTKFIKTTTRILQSISPKTENSNISIRDLWPSRQDIEQIEDEIIIKKILNQFNETIQVDKKKTFFSY